MKTRYFLLGLFFCTIFGSGLALAENRFIQVQANSREQRNAIVNRGMSIEFVRSDSVWGFANERSITRLQTAGFKILSNLAPQVGRGGHQGIFDSLEFPPSDRKFHTFQQVTSTLQELARLNPDIARLQSIGKTIENRDIWALQINSSVQSLDYATSNKPGVVFMGNHHAREHLSVEVPVMLAQYLLEHRNDPKISSLLNSRDIWILPMINPDGAEFDIEGGQYQYWRKNRRNNGDGTFGVDLNRNYGYKWGTGGSDSDTSSDIYMGNAPFSEPETQAVRDFVNIHPNTKVLLTFHSYSELILYPWGHSETGIDSAQDRAVFEKMAQTMALWNHYKPEQSSELYVTSGDTTDWAYGEKGIFAFTFELSPNTVMNGGFYPGAKVIEQVFKDNLNPCIYLIDMAGNPYQVLDKSPSQWLTHSVEINTEPTLLRELYPAGMY